MIRRSDPIHMRRCPILPVLIAIFGLLGAADLSAQGLADFDYEDLTFRGVGLHVGQVSSSKIVSTTSFGGRVDLGFLGPGVRVIAGIDHWSSRLAAREVSELEESLEQLILDQTGEAIDANLGRITWSDVALQADAHILWRIPLGILTYLGGGASAHVLRGGGQSVDDTFVDDLLDSVRAGANVHAGVEYPVHPRFRIFGEARYELLEDLSYAQFRVGGQFHFGALAVGES